MRDSQKQRLYDAEQMIRGIVGRKLADGDACRRYVDSVVASQWWRQRCGVQKVTLDESPHRRTWARASFTMRGYVIKIPARHNGWAHTDFVLIHELAHVYVRATKKCWTHGPEFAAAFLDMTRHFIGGQAAKELQAAFRLHRVRFRPKRVRPALSAAERRIVRDRFLANLARARLAKQEQAVA